MRRIEVSSRRLPGWLTRFGEVHLGAQATAVGNTVHLAAPDGAVATLTAWPCPTPGLSAADVGRWAHGPERIALVLVRRGGWAVGVAEGDEVPIHRTGRRYVQSRTAAGGWSQQRFARRRANQADALARHVSAAVTELLDSPVTALVVGGDKALVAEVLQAHEELAVLPTRRFYDIADPRLHVLESVADRARSALIDIDDPTRG